MPVPAAYSLAADTSASTPTCSVGNTITLTGAIPSSGYNGALRTIHAAVSDGDVFPIRVYGTDAGGAASVELMVSYVSATKVATITSILTEVGAASPVVLTSITAIELIQSVDQVSAPRGHIEFDSPQHITYDATDPDKVTIAAGRGWIDDEYLEWSAQNDAGTFSAEGLHYVYLYNNAGTVDIDKSATVPAWNSARGFWIKTGDATRRCIGWVLVWQEGTGSTYRIVPFTATHSNRNIRIAYSGEDSGADEFDAGDNQVLLDSGRTTSTGPTAFDLFAIAGDIATQELVPEAMITSWICAAKLTADTGTSDDGILAIVPHVVSGSPTWIGNQGTFSVRTQPGSAGPTFFGRWDVPYAGSDPYAYLQVNGGTVTFVLECWGGSCQI